MRGELKAQNKANKFVDRRFSSASNGIGGERNSREAVGDHKRVRFELSSREKPAARDTLTHKGIPLDSEVSEAYDDGPVDDYSDDDIEDFGAATSKKDSQKKSSLQVTLDEIIRNSKKQKAEKQMENERNAKLIDVLDAEWRALCKSAADNMKKDQEAHHDHDHEKSTTSAKDDEKKKQKTEGKTKQPEVKSSVVSRLAVAAKSSNGRVADSCKFQSLLIDYYTVV